MTKWRKMDSYVQFEVITCQCQRNELQLVEWLCFIAPSHCHGVELSTDYQSLVGLHQPYLSSP